ncbi:hypothetical protein AALO_G00274460 [Alosa alosa]|uniref:Maturase n=1 Tax=Alosa alosa TaxID=278164 RepID=A0AAV6FMS4_9TELE|nr:hypothetical protein AALO_G00274460 [Alosa alosa]
MVASTHYIILYQATPSASGTGIKRKKKRMSESLPPQKKARIGEFQTMVKRFREQDDDDDDHRWYFRMSVAKFDELVCHITPFITHESIQSIPVGIDERLALTLHFLAQGSFLDTLSSRYKLEQRTISMLIPEVCQAIWKSIQPGLALGLPKKGRGNPQRWRVLKMTAKPPVLTWSSPPDEPNRSLTPRERALLHPHVATCIYLLIYIILYQATPPGQGDKQRKRRMSESLPPPKKARIGMFQTLVQELREQDDDDEHHRGYFRMSVAKFDELVCRITPFITHESIQSIPVGVDERLALTLHFLAHGSFLDTLSLDYRLEQLTISMLIPEVCRAIWKSIQPGLALGLPKKGRGNPQRWRVLKSDFYSATDIKKTCFALNTFLKH